MSLRLIPAIDLRDGKCVRLYQGRFDAETVYDADPSRVLTRYRALGARCVHVVDLDGARDGSQGNRAAIERLAHRFPDVSLQVGGGIRSREVAANLLALGVARVVIGSAAVSRPADVQAWMRDFGADRVVLAFDVRLDAHGTPRLTTHGWEAQTEASLWAAVADYLAHHAKHVLCTDVARDGALSGPNVALYTEAAQRFPAIEWQASGGVASGADLRALADTGAAAVISGRALLEERIPVEELQPFLPDA
ncbi:MAG TPA: 1-(5-phosphoribosyl)-5-[(5-phosphoribosylamino)methylideneamino] imidazole-4-carboxamide isomerase [Steroidobacteraceae bacterium]|nr:1-(5-phosphoribosyl)-5-[(5-phosphoribosylamino)methylideneamino] imidazole-4-carboxamide isomerase [Steroidobacteraceae bacterium]